MAWQILNVYMIIAPITLAMAHTFDQSILDSKAKAWMQEEEHHGLKMLQTKRSLLVRDCPLPDPQKFVSRVGKGCPNPGKVNGAWGTSCLNLNRPYARLSEAWEKCGATPGCGAVMRYSNGKFFLRRESDPDDATIKHVELYPYQCKKAAQHDGESAEIGAQAATRVDQATKTETKLQEDAPNAAADVCRGSGFSPLGQVRGAYAQMQQRFHRAVELINNRSLTFLEPAALNLHKQLIMDVEEAGVPGYFAETGVAKGGSALILAAVKNPQRCLHLYDTFEGIPKPSPRDHEDVWNRYRQIQEGNGGKDYYGYINNLAEYVPQQFRDADLAPEKYGVSFHKGLFQDTFHPTGDIAYLHLDGDWYESTRVVVKRAIPMLATNGIMIFDDVLHSWSGATDALNDFFGIDVNVLRERPQRSIIDVEKDGKLFEVVKDTRLYIKRVE